MNLLVFIIVVLVVLGLVYWMLELLPFPQPPKRLILVVAILAGIIAILDRAGLLRG